MSKPRPLTTEEEEYCRLRAEEGLGPILAARKAFNWRCDPGSVEYAKAKSLGAYRNLNKRIKEIRALLDQQAEADKIVTQTGSIDLDNLRSSAYKRLVQIRDDETLPPTARLKAVEALEKLSDPSKDINLIWRWLDIAVKGAMVHCPCCHKNFHAEKLALSKLAEYRKKANVPALAPTESLLERRKAILNIAEKRQVPHPGQVRALEAQERHIMGMGAGRVGKSFTLAMFAYLYAMQPGTVIWILGLTYEAARWEKDYLKRFLETAFFPYSRFLFEEIYDSKNQEWVLTTRWGSEVRIKSAKAVGSITGAEVDAILAAEPGWLPDNIFNHVRARLSSRLGRIIALGTPQSLGGFIARLVFPTGRLPDGRIKRWTAEERLLSNGAAWNISALVFNMEAKDNPGYVKSELEAARMEMSDEEYATEFEGKMVAHEGLKFHSVKQVHLQSVSREVLAECEWILGVDQGQKNFGAVLMAWDGKKAYAMRDFFDNSYNTIRTNLINLRDEVPVWIRAMGGDQNRWKLTIFDQDPPIENTLMEMEQESKEWPTAVTYRHDNKKKQGMTEDWRKDTTILINEMAKQGNLIFDNECSQLHDEVMRTEVVAGNPLVEDGSNLKHKGWKIAGSWRQDHVLDGLMFCMWLIRSNQVERPTMEREVGTPEEEARKAYEYQRRIQEQRDLSGFQKSKKSSEVFQDVFGRSPNTGREFIPGGGSYYDDY
jgi:hypothetical protein